MEEADLAAAVDEMSEELGVLGDIVGYHLRRASAAFAVDFARALAGTGIRQVLFGILSVVSANPGINQGAVGTRLGIQRANMVALINDLVDRGLLERKTSEDDRRAFSLTVSAAGDAMLAECLVRIRTHEAEMLADITPTEKARLLDVLAKIGGKPA